MAQEVAERLTDIALGKVKSSPTEVSAANAVLDRVVAKAPPPDAETAHPSIVLRSEAAFLEPEVVHRIANSMAEPYDLLVQILGTLGLRWGEAAALRRRSVDLLGRRLIIAESVTEGAGRLVSGPTKTHAQRRVPLPASISDRL